MNNMKILIVCKFDDFNRKRVGTIKIEYFLQNFFLINVIICLK